MPEVIREIVQNSLDEAGEYQVVRKPEGLAICDKGKGLRARHLLLGITEKENENARGKFGEGLKIACVVAERLGHHITIKSHDLNISSYKAKLTLPDETIEEVLGLKVDHLAKEDSLLGTEVTINGYTGPDYSENFLYAKDPRILKEYSGGSILSGSGKGKLFVKGIYVQDLVDATYGYNLLNVTLEESRKVANEKDVQDGIGRLWTYVGDTELIEEFLEAKHYGNAYEAKCPLGKWLISPEKWKEAWKANFGSKAVIATSDAYTAQCQWLKGKPIQLFDDVEHFAKETGIMTDVQFVKEHSKADTEKVTEKSLDIDKRKLFSLLKKVARDVGYTKKIKLVKFINGEFTGTSNGKYIQLDSSILNDPIVAFGTLLHELTHDLKGTHDNYEGMIRAFEQVAGLAMAKRFKLSKKMMKQDV
jgi:hypothetical protein